MFSYLIGFHFFRHPSTADPLLRGLLLTLLFLQAVGLQRTWDLRGYTGQALALLTGRQQAYGYRHTERFLAALAAMGADALLSESLAHWTASVWEQEPQGREKPVPVFSVDGYRNPVYADALIPRGLIGRTGEVLGCRAFVVLRDQEGHPLLVTTHRGDQHLTLRLPAILMHYEQATSLVSLKRVVVDREGMSAESLAALTSEGWTVVTILRTDQYAGFSVIPGGQRVFPVASRSTEQGHSGGGAGMFWSTIIRTPWTRGGARQKWLENVQRWTVGARKGC